MTGCYHPNGKKVWRVSEDGAFRDPFRALDSVFMMPEFAFFEHYSRIGENNDQYLNSCKEEYEYAVSQLPELPFGNAWIAQKYISKLPRVLNYISEYIIVCVLGIFSGCQKMFLVNVM